MAETRSVLDVPANPVARALVRLALGLLAALPRGFRANLARAFGRLAFVLGIRRALTLENLRHAFPDKTDVERRALAKKTYENMALAILEALLYGRVPLSVGDDALTFPNFHLIEKALAKGKGLLVATAHFGSWEMLGEMMVKKGLKLNAVVRPLKGALNAELMENRVKGGLGLIPPGGAVQGIVDALNRNEVVVVLIDQGIAPSRAVFVPFFGRPAATSPALALAAQRCEATVMVGVAAREGERMHAMLEGPFPAPKTSRPDEDLVTHTATLTHELEKMIRRYPDQWLWLHRRWKHAPP